MFLFLLIIYSEVVTLFHKTTAKLEDDSMSESSCISATHAPTQTKDRQISYDSTDLNANNFSVDQELFLSEIKQEPVDTDDETQNAEIKTETWDARPMENKSLQTTKEQTWFVRIKKEAFLDRINDSELCFENNVHNFFHDNGEENLDKEGNKETVIVEADVENLCLESDEKLCLESDEKLGVGSVESVEQKFFPENEDEKLFLREDVKDFLIDKNIASYTCHVCNRTFKRKDQLIRDLIIHGLIEPFICDLCGKKFNRKDIILKHISIVHGFAPELGLKIRKNTSVSDVSPPSENSFKPFQCDVCNKTFKRFDSIKRHKRSHFNERRFACHFCNLSFTQTSILKRHIQSHTKETPFCCGLCNKKYTRKYILSRHIAKIHSGENFKKPLFPCSLCEKEFTSAVYVKNHLRKMHKVDLKFEKL